MTIQSVPKKTRRGIPPSGDKPKPRAKMTFYRMTPADFDDGCFKTIARNPDLDADKIRGSYVRLLHLQFSGVLLRGQPKTIAYQFGSNPEVVAAVLADHFTKTLDGKVPIWSNRRMAECVKFYDDTVERMRGMAIEGVKKRSTRKANKNANSSAQAQPRLSDTVSNTKNLELRTKKKEQEELHSTVEVDNSSSPLVARSASDKSSGTPSKKISSKVAFPQNWVLPVEYRELALKLKLSPDEIEAEAVKFQHWALNSVKGGKPIKRDWPATWRTWLRNVTDRKANQRVRSSAPIGASIKTRRL